MSPKDIAVALVPPLAWGAGFTLAKPAVEQFQPLFMMVIGIVNPLRLRRA